MKQLMKVTKVEGNLLGIPVRMGGLGFTDPVVTSSSELQEHLPPDVSEIRTHCKWEAGAGEKLPADKS